MQKIIRVATYRRVSTDRQAKEGDSLEAQKTKLMGYIEMFPNYQFIEDYCDDGFSGQKVNRHAYMRLLEDVKKKRIDLIIFTKLDRWFRNLTEYLNTQKLLEKYGVKWKAVLENYDTTTAAGEAVTNIIMSINQMEAKQTGERIKFVFDDKIQKGEVISGVVPYGYKIEDKHFVIDEEKAHHVRETYKTFLQCGSVRATMLKMNSTLFYCNVDRIHKILSNPIYIGIYDKSGRKNEHYCEPIIEEVIYYKAQKLLECNVKKYDYNPGAVAYSYIFRGLLYCPECGSRLSSSKYKYSSKNYEGEYKYYYRCHKRRNKHCSFKTNIYEDQLEEYLLKVVSEQLQGRITSLESISSDKSSTNKNVPERLKKRLAKLKDLYLDELIDKEEYVAEYNSIKEELDRIEKEETPSKEAERLRMIKEEFDRGFNEFYKDFTNEEKRLFWYSIISRIEVIDKENFIIHFV